MSDKIKCALIGPGNIGTDLLAKLQRSPVLEPVTRARLPLSCKSMPRPLNEAH